MEKQAKPQVGQATPTRLASGSGEAQAPQGSSGAQYTSYYFLKGYTALEGSAGATVPAGPCF